MKSVFVPSIELAGDKPRELVFPDNWDVTWCGSEAETKPVLANEEIRKVLENPIGSHPLSKVVEGRSEVVIVIDDSTRGTKTYRLLPHVLSTLEKSGVSDENVRFVMASGAHGPHGRVDFARKLGDDVLERFAVYNHNPYDNLTHLGTTGRGTPVDINAEVMGCDLKIGIGSVVWHTMFGFTGGAKMILPGVSGIETIQHNHGNVGGFGPGFTPHPTCGYLKNEGNIMRLDAEETARIAGLDFKIDAVNNLERDPVALYAGDFVAEQRLAAKTAFELHGVQPPTGMDIVVVNAYGRGNESSLAMRAAYPSVKDNGAIVLIPNAPDGDINHWIFGRHGKWLGSRLSRPGARRPLTKGRRLIIFSPHKDQGLRIGLREQTIWVKTWQDVVEELSNDYRDSAKVCVYPDATVQFAKP